MRNVLFFFFTIISFSVEASIIPRLNNRIENRKCEVAIAAIFQNEGPYLKEWIEYHRMIGVEHFYLYNNQSTDNFEKILKPYVAKGIVELFDVPVDLSDGKIYLDWQVNVYNHALKMSRKSNEWVAFIDIDEFICLINDDDLPTFLANYLYAGGVCINWVMYGTSNIYDLSDTDLLIEKLIYRYPFEWGENSLVKSIVRPKHVVECIDAHTFRFQGNVFAVYPNHQKYTHTPNFTIPVDQARINHYWFRTEKFFYDVKLPRRRRWGDGRTEEQIQAQMKLANSVEDRSMDRFVTPLKKRLKKQR